MPVQEIAMVLNNLITLHEELLEFAQQKQQVLISNKVDELSILVKKETKLLKQVTAYDSQIVTVSEKFLQDQGVAIDSPITISELHRYIFNINERKVIIDAQDRLLHTIQELKKINDLNQQLIEQSLQFIDFSIDLLTDSEDNTVYQNPQKQNQGSTRNGMFDTKA